MFMFIVLLVMNHTLVQEILDLVEDVEDAVLTAVVKLVADVTVILVEYVNVVDRIVDVLDQNLEDCLEIFHRGNQE